MLYCTREKNYDYWNKRQQGFYGIYSFTQVIYDLKIVVCITASIRRALWRKSTFFPTVASSLHRHLVHCPGHYWVVLNQPIPHHWIFSVIETHLNTVKPLTSSHPKCWSKVASQKGWPVIRGSQECRPKNRLIKAGIFTLMGIWLYVKLS